MTDTTAAMAHTPTPWKVFNGTDIFPDDGDREGLRHISDCAMTGYLGGDEQTANAAFIVRAVNAYDSHRELIATLCRALEDMLPENNADDQHCRPSFERCEASRNAISLATEQGFKP